MLFEFERKIKEHFLDTRVVDSCNEIILNFSWSLKNK